MLNDLQGHGHSYTRYSMDYTTFGLAVCVTSLARNARDSANSLESGPGGASLTSSTSAQYDKSWTRFGEFCAATRPCHGATGQEPGATGRATEQHVYLTYLAKTSQGMGLGMGRSMGGQGAWGTPVRNADKNLASVSRVMLM